MKKDDKKIKHGEDKNNGSGEKRLRIGRNSADVLYILKESSGSLVDLLLVRQLYALYPQLDPDKRKKKVANIKHKTIKSLRNQGLVWVKKYDGKIHFGLTEKGEQELKKRSNFSISEINKRKKKWDKQWRIVIWDIPESKRLKRDLLRRALSKYGFIKIQHSVWVYPYDCEELVGLLRAHFKIGKEVQFMTVKKIESDAWLRKKFKL